MKRQLSALNKSLKRLSLEQGPRARRNARRAVMQALRGIRDEMNASFPAPPRKVEPRATGLTVEQRQVRQKRRLRREGFTSTSDLSSSEVFPLLKLCAVAGVRAEKVGDSTWIPTWVYQVWKGNKASITNLKTAKRDAHFRKALVTEATLLAQAAQTR